LFVLALDIAHAINQYVRIGGDLVEGPDIVTATKNLAGKKKPRVETIAGISKYNFWQWPIAGPLAGYIVARPLPHFGSSVHFSPTMIANLYNEEIFRPEPKISSHTEPQS
ncbi:22429_t:CDS:2, partial [Gigaspora rosea]